jgi:hypothetical protein
MANVSLSELSRRIGRDKSLVSRWVKQGKIPKPSNGLFDEDAVRRALKGNLDPTRAKPLAPPVAVTCRDAPTANPLIERVDFELPGTTVNEADGPQPDAYRLRRDLPDDFSRGAVYALHRLAFVIPDTAAIDAAFSGSTAKVAYTVHHRMRFIITYSVIEEICRGLGLIEGRQDLPKHLRPPSFFGIIPEYLARIADEKVDVPAWEQWRLKIEEYEDSL